MAIAFKHLYKSDSLIGTDAIKFRPYTVATPLPQLSTPANVSVSGTTVTFDEVENATSYEVFADGESIGTGYNSTLIIYDSWNSDDYVQYSIDGGNTFTSISIPTSGITPDSPLRVDLGLISSIIFKVKCYGGFKIDTSEGYEIIDTLDDTQKITDEFVLSNSTEFTITRLYD